MPSGSSSDGQQPFRVQKLYTAFRRCWWVFLISVPLAVAAGIAFWRYQPSAYYSAAKMWLPGQLRVNDLAQYVEDLQNFSGTQLEIMRSDELDKRAMKRIERMLQTNTTLKVNLHDKKAHPVLTASQIPKTVMFELEVTSPDPNLAQAYLNALMDEFLLYKKEVFAETSGDVVASVSEQVSKQEKALKAEQEKLNRFKSENNLAQLEEESKGGGNQLARLSDQLAMLRLEMKMLDAFAIERAGGVGLSTNAPIISKDVAQVLNLPGAGVTPIPVDVISAEEQLQLLKARHAELSRFLRPKHPKVVKINEEIARAESLSRLYRQRSMDQLANSRESLRIRIDSLETTVRELEIVVAHSSRRLADYEGIKADIQRQQSVYDRLLTLLQGLDLNGSIDRGSLAILERASRPTPIRRHLSQIGVLSACLGIVIAFSVLFLLAYFDDRCETVEDLKAEFSEEVLGQLPELKGDRTTGAVPLLSQGDHPLFNESLRNLRSSLLFGYADRPPPRVIVITSATPDEGKSTVAANLAEALAMGGARVLLVDADMRCGRLHGMFQLPAVPGLSELLQNSAELSSCVASTSIPTLSFIPRGRVARNSGELFLTTAFGNFLQRARDEFDYVLFDTVPLMAADDAATLAPKSDGVIFVLRRSFTRAGLAHEALEQLYRRGVSVLGLVLNRVDAALRGHRYYKYTKYHLTDEQINSGL